MLHEFLRANRDDLIRRCRFKVSQRSSPPATASELQYGVPRMLDQLSEALQEDCISGYSPSAPGAAEAQRTAALHGVELFRLGYSVDQVVHDYGDLCQAMTELAKEDGAIITVDEFHTFNRLLDCSIASAVAAYVHLQHAATREQRALLDVALKALDKLKVETLGLAGATGPVLEESLLKLRDVIDRSLPEIRTARGIRTPAARRRPS